MVYPLWLSSGDGRELVPRLGIEHCEECCGNPVAMGLVDHPGFGKDGVGVGGTLLRKPQTPGGQQGRAVFTSTGTFW